MYKGSAGGVKHVWFLPSITGGRAESACCMGSLLAGRQLGWSQLSREVAGAEAAAS